MIRKAVIPVAGRGKRLMPVSSVVPKAMFPLVNGRNEIRSVLYIICQQVISVGIETIAIVVSPRQINMFRRYFDTVQESDLDKLPIRIEYRVQASPKGFGDAVMQAAEFIGDEPFMLLLGDHVYIEDRNRPSCPAQVAEAFHSTGGVAMVGVQPVSANVLREVGVVSGVEIQTDMYRCLDFVEKPDPITAQRRLVTENLPEGTFLAHCGIYVFTPEILSCLQQLSNMNRASIREIEVAEAQSMLLKRHSDKYFLYKIAGRAYDIGTPEGYAVSQAAFRNKEVTV